MRLRLSHRSYGLSLRGSVENPMELTAPRTESISISAKLADQAAAYDDDRALGKRLYVHGPESFTLTTALQRLIEACCPQTKVGELGDPTEANTVLAAPSDNIQRVDRELEEKR